jgi:hypothetical protein
VLLPVKTIPRIINEVKGGTGITVTMLECVELYADA